MELGFVAPLVVIEPGFAPTVARKHALMPSRRRSRPETSICPSLVPAPPGYKETRIDDFIEEVSGFPNAAFDDQVDAMTQALRKLTGTGGPHRIRSGGRTLTGGLLDKQP